MKSGNFERVSDEEDRSVVANQVVVAVLCVELDGKASWIVGLLQERLFHRQLSKNARIPQSAFQRGTRSELGSTWNVSAVTSKWPWAPEPRACTILSGMRSR